MKNVELRPYADPGRAARRLVAIAKGVPPIDGRIHIEKINAPMLNQYKATGEEYWAGLMHAVDKGWLTYHESGTYVTLLQAGTDLFDTAEQ